MRTAEDRLEFCGHVMHAASRLGISISYFTNRGKHRYIWTDLMAGVAIECKIANSQPEALEIACEALTHYFNPQSNEQGEPAKT